MNEYLDLHALADGQLEGDAKAVAEAKLKTCERSQAEYFAVQHLKDTLASKCEGMNCEKTWSRCQERLKEIDRAKRVEGFVGKYAWGLCGAFLMCIVIGGSLNRMSGSGVRTGDVARISASLSPLSLPGTSDKNDALSQIMGGKMATQPETLQVVSGASGFMEGHKIVKLNLLDSMGPMAFFLFEETTRIDDAQNLTEKGFAICNVNGTNGLGWVEGHHAYLLIGDRPIDELEVIASAIRGK